MADSPSVTNHAIDRLKERFDIDDDWLIDQLEQGRFVWLPGSGDGKDEKKIRSGHLLYIPSLDAFCVAVMDNRSRRAITVLTEEMATNSSWGKGINDSAKLRAKRMMLGDVAVDDIEFIRLQVKESEKVPATVLARSVNYKWEGVVISLCKINLKHSSIDIESKAIMLSGEQIKLVSGCIKERINGKEMRPFCHLFLRTNRGHKASIANKFPMLSDLQSADLARRWQA